jgi:metal-responsive CopG/Arc/MetJ family transcriptional regulator
MKEEKKQIGVILPKDLVAKLDAAAQQQGLKRSGYIRQLLIQVLSQ